MFLVHQPSTWGPVPLPSHRRWLRPSAWQGPFPSWCCLCVCVRASTRLICRTAMQVGLKLFKKKKKNQDCRIVFFFPALSNRKEIKRGCCNNSPKSMPMGRSLAGCFLTNLGITIFFALSQTSAEPVRGHHVGDMVGCIASGWSWGLRSLMALRASCIVSKGWRSETQFSSPLPSPLIHPKWNKRWVLFLLSKMPVVFRSSPMCKSAVITSGL